MRGDGKGEVQEAHRDTPRHVEITSIDHTDNLLAPCTTIQNTHHTTSTHLILTLRRRLRTTKKQFYSPTLWLPGTDTVPRRKARAMKAHVAGARTLERHVTAPAATPLYCPPWVPLPCHQSKTINRCPVPADEYSDQEIGGKWLLWLGSTRPWTKFSD